VRGGFSACARISRIAMREIPEDVSGSEIAEKTVLCSARARNSTHGEYDAERRRTGAVLRDVLAGEDAVKQPVNAICRDWIRSRMRSISRTGTGLRSSRATARTAEGYSGLIFRRPPFVEAPEGRQRSRIFERLQPSTSHTNCSGFDADLFQPFHCTARGTSAPG